MVATYLFARVFSDHRDNVVSAEVYSPRGDFTIQFTENKSGNQFWNVCSSPPNPREPVGLELENSGRIFDLWNTELASPDAAAEEFSMLLGVYGGDEAVVHSAKTYHSPHVPSVRKALKKLGESVRSFVR